MKTINFILLSSLLVILFNGCNSHGNSEPPYDYYLKLKFEDNSGKNLVKGIKYDQTTHSSTVSGTSFLVNLNEYILETSVANEPMKSEALWIEIDNYQYECIFTSYSTFDYVASTITQKLKCQHIFGDNKEHVIISYWNKNLKDRPSCSKITCDNKEFQVIKEEGAVEYTALITLTP